MAEDTHLDKFGSPLAQGDKVEVVYGGAFHEAFVTGLRRELDVDHIELQLTTPAVVPAGSVKLLKKAPPAPKAQDVEPTPQDPKTRTTRRS